jgi:hypothetical protein
MAGRGPAPKDPSKRRRRNADPVPTTYAIADGQVRGPELPDGIEWHAQTLAWWATWRTSAQAKVFTDTDWRFLIDTALLHHAMWSGDRSAATEVRLRVTKFGATPEDRARLRLQVSSSADESKPADGAAPKPGGRYGHLRDVSA